MLLTRDMNHGDFEIRSYEPGFLKINETIYTQSLLVGPHQLELWPPQRFEEITTNHLEPILAMKPRIIIFGTGAVSHFPESSFLKRLYEQNIGTEIMNTLSACHTFNVLMSEGRNAVAALIIR
jgi:uncharacterized protein